MEWGTTSTTPEWMRTLLDTPLPVDSPWEQSSGDSNQEPLAGLENVAKTQIPSEASWGESEATPGLNWVNAGLTQSTSQWEEPSIQGGQQARRDLGECASAPNAAFAAGAQEAHQNEMPDPPPSAATAAFDQVPSKVANDSTPWIQQVPAQIMGSPSSFQEDSSLSGARLGRPSDLLCGTAGSSADQELQSFVSACFFSGLRSVDTFSNLSNLPDWMSPRQNEPSSPESSVTTTEEPSQSQATSNFPEASGACPTTSAHGAAFADVSTWSYIPAVTSVEGRPVGGLEAALQRALTHATRKSSPSISTAHQTDLPRRWGSLVAPSTGLPAGTHSKQKSYLPRLALPRSSTMLSESSVKSEDLGEQSPESRSMEMGTPGLETDEEEGTALSHEHGEGMEDALARCGAGKRKRILRERQRRSNIRQQVKRLKAVLPAGQGAGAHNDTASIIAAAADYIRELKGL